MTSAPYQPLSPEERELAQRLAQLGAPGGPPASLDAQILSAAHAALADKSSRPSRRQRRWPLALGAVATLVLAVGVAWQLRPRPNAEQAYSEAPVATRTTHDSGPSAAEELPTADLSATVAAPEVDAAQVKEAPPPPSPAPVVPAQKAEPKPPAPVDNPAVEAEAAEAFPREPERRTTPSAAAAAPAPPAPPPPRADIVFDQPAPIDAQAATAPATGANAATGSARVRREAASEAKQARQESDALDQIVVTGTRIDGPDEEHDDARDNAGYSDQEIDDQPPATADSPLVQKAWLQRIRELIANGKQDEARNSLTEFKRRYPRYALPQDLQELLP